MQLWKHFLSWMHWVCFKKIIVWFYFLTSGVSIPEVFLYWYFLEL